MLILDNMYRNNRANMATDCDVNFIALLNVSYIFFFQFWKNATYNFQFWEFSFFSSCARSYFDLLSILIMKPFYLRLYLKNESKIHFN
ncbi:hypothetical protein DSECCO2_102140 [anaerobic digester metagenome]